MDKKVLIFVDGPNWNHQQEEMEISCKFDKLREVLSGDRELLGVRYYTTPAPTPAAKGFQEYLRKLGYLVITCEQGQDVDDLLAKDLKELKGLGYADEPDTIVIVSGDNRFAEILGPIVEKGKTAEVVSLSTTLSADYAGIADHVDPLDFKDKITDLAKTMKRQKQAAVIAADKMPGAEFIGTLMALGNKVTIEARASELIIRITLPPNHKE